MAGIREEDELAAILSSRSPAISARVCSRSPEKVCCSSAIRRCRVRTLVRVTSLACSMLNQRSPASDRISCCSVSV
jgi:hypothetical protein